jgi:hypothetical protein
MLEAQAPLLVHAAATWFMVGLIWFVQVVHYPLFAAVGDRGYPAYQAAHMARTGRVVGPAMLAELLSGLVLVWRPPAGVPAPLPWVGLALLAAVWLSTALVQVPLHDRLRAGFDPDAGRRLVGGNWLRTALWSGRGVLVLAMLVFALAA